MAVGQLSLFGWTLRQISLVAHLMAYGANMIETQAGNEPFGYPVIKKKCEVCFHHIPFFKVIPHKKIAWFSWISVACFLSRFWTIELVKVLIVMVF